ncbi:hypothetical protein HPB47_005802 [Ixodes persulcatus]|uniref:Uncharacterized protein n=1 Tax=Ixodes persulcatus TaxID=34615 RepID=A0AC60PC25_IXOPE|nr:hypothetical protein HPB47_005802 [Ixodes persulcatus]
MDNTHFIFIMITITAVIHSDIRNLWHSLQSRATTPDACYSHYDLNVNADAYHFHQQLRELSEVVNVTPKPSPVFATRTSKTGLTASNDRKANAKKKLQHRQQQNEETYTSYIEDVLTLCRRADADMRVAKNPPTTSELRQTIREIVREEIKRLNTETPVTIDHGDLSTDLRALVQEELTHAASTALTMSSFTYNGSTHSRTHKHNDVLTLETDQLYPPVLLLRQ